MLPEWKTDLQGYRHFGGRLAISRQNFRQMELGGRLLRKSQASPIAAGVNPRLDSKP
jgi:hypothetical protein